MKKNKYRVFIYRLDILMKNHNITGGNLIVKNKKNIYEIVIEYCHRIRLTEQKPSKTNARKKSDT